MIYLIIGILCSSMLSILMRISEKYVKGNIAMLVVNYITCAVISALSIGPGNIFTAQDGIGKTVFIGVIAGALYLTGFVMLQYNIKKNGVVLPATFMKLGLLVSTAFPSSFSTKDRIYCRLQALSLLLPPLSLSMPKRMPPPNLISSLGFLSCCLPQVWAMQ